MDKFIEISPKMDDIPVVDIKDIKILKLISRAGNDHLITEAEYHGESVVFRDCIREEAKQKSERQTIASFKLPQVIDNINHQLEPEGLIIFETPVTFAVVRENGKYRGSIQSTLQKPEESEDLYPQEMYNNGVAKRYSLTFSRWTEIKSLETKQQISELIDKYKVEDSKSINELEKTIRDKEVELEALVKDTDTQLALINSRMNIIEDRTSTEEIDKLRTIITGWQKEMDSSVEIDAISSKFVQLLQAELINDPEYVTLKQSKQSLFQDHNKKYSELDIDKPKLEIQNYEQYKSFSSRIKTLANSDMPIEKIMETTQEIIDEYRVEYDSMLTGKLIFKAINMIEENGFSVDIDGVGNLRSYYKHLKGKKTLVIQLFDVGQNSS